LRAIVLSTVEADKGLLIANMLIHRM
jgi:hypothetical protein